MGFTFSLLSTVEVIYKLHKGGCPAVETMFHV